MRLRVHGGPADGAFVAYAGGAWRWIDGASERGYSRQRSGTGLYRREGRGWVYAGEEPWLCVSCGAVVLERVAACPVCDVSRVGSIEEVLDGEGG